jgi:chromatin remodeling complex protein RSC6
MRGEYIQKMPQTARGASANPCLVDVQRCAEMYRKEKEEKEKTQKKRKEAKKAETKEAKKAEAKENKKTETKEAKLHKQWAKKWSAPP